MESSSLEAFVKYGLGPAGAGVILGAILYFLAKMVPSFETLSGITKRWVIFGISLTIPVVLLIIARFVLGQAVNYDTVFVGLVSGISTFVSSTMIQAKDLPQSSVERQLGQEVLTIYERQLNNPTRSPNPGAEMMGTVSKYVLRDL